VEGEKNIQIQPDYDASFRGMAPLHVFRGVLDDVDDQPSVSWYGIRDAGDLIDAIKDRKLAHVVAIDQTERVALFFDFIHFSIVTSATVGFGDVSPKSMIAKMIVDTQILCSAAIILFGLGMALSAQDPPATNQES
jgi:hypothetical protein